MSPIEPLPDLCARERLVRICDVCGRDSFSPVWLATQCGGFIAAADRMVRCHGHFVDPVALDERQNDE